MQVPEDLMHFLFPPAYAMESPPDGDEPDESEGEDEEESDENAGPEPGERDHVHDHEDPISASSESKPRDHEVKTSKEHPLGDYSRALFEYARELVNELAKGSSEAKDLKELWDEAERAMSFHANWERSTTNEYSPMGDQVRSWEVDLVPDYIKVEMLGMYLGLESTSTTGGQHVPGSAHYKAGAVDFRTRGLSQARIDQVAWVMRNAGVFVRNEQGHPLTAKGPPQEQWSGAHLHVQSVPTDPRINGPLDRWSNPPFKPGTYVPGSTGSGARWRRGQSNDGAVSSNPGSGLPQR